MWAHPVRHRNTPSVSFPNFSLRTKGEIFFDHIQWIISILHLSLSVCIRLAFHHPRRSGLHFHTIIYKPLLFRIKSLTQFTVRLVVFYRIFFSILEFKTVGFLLHAGTSFPALCLKSRKWVVIPSGHV